MFLTPSQPVSARRIWLARGIAVAADAAEFVFLPFLSEGFASPLEIAIDAAACALLTLLVGWHIAFLPSFLIKALPLADIAPTWTIAIFIATRKAASAPAKALPGPE